MSSSLAVPQGRRPSRTWHWLSAWTPVALCVGAIALESTVMFGADHTSGPLQRLFEFLFNRHFTQPEWWRFHHIVRKTGHFTGYGLMSIAWFRAFWMTWHTDRLPARRQFPTHLLAMLGTFLVASSDEFHQTFLPNRTGTYVDVLIDCSGALLMQLLVAAWLISRRTK